MAITIDIHPKGEGTLVLTAKAMGTSGDPVTVEISSTTGGYMGDVTFFMRAAHLAKRLEVAINAAMKEPDGEGKPLKDALEELIGPEGGDAVGGT